MKGMYNLIRSEKGAAFMIVLILIVLLFLIGGAVLILTLNHCRLTRYLIDSTRAFYLTEAGIARVVYKIRTEANPSNETFSLEGTNIFITLSTDPTDNLAFYVIATTDSATSPGNVVCAIDATMTRSAIPPPTTPVTITNWNEIRN